MSKALIITEKPSVARDIVAALGGFTAHGGGAYWESSEFLCSYAVGHIFTLFEPEDIDSAYKQWRLSSLPILPKSFQLKPIPGHETRISLLQKLVERADVKVVINACDAAREGELIFRELVSFTGTRKWVQRLWLQSMTAEAIRSGFKNLRDGTDLEGLGQAAECRARTDWLIGMNATRAFSEQLRPRGERTPWSVGRVQTPTLALLVQRELQVLGHRPRPYYRLQATFDAGTHRYEGTWFDPKFKVQADDLEAKDDRLWDKPTAEALAAATLGQPALASETRDESLRHAPYLFNLTGLQKYLAQRFKWSAKRTLEAAQRCYESHKVLTYPRTSSVCLPEDYRGEVQRLIAGLGQVSDYAAAAQYLIANGRLNEARTFRNAGVTDHFAIIPTGKHKSLSGDDARLYDAVVRRFLATFHPPAVYDKVKRITLVAGQSFRTGPLETLVTPGWLSVYERSAEGPTKVLPALRPGEKKAAQVPVKTLSATINSETTRPPPRINEAGLLGLMEHAGRQIDDQELQAALTGAEGLGTAATRADIIQNLKVKGYVDDTLRPTFKGIHLIRTLHHLQVNRLTSPELTARLELELAEVEAGKRSAATFMSEVNRYTTEVVDAAKRLDWAKIYPDKEPIGVCPLCLEHGTTKQVYERPFVYACETVVGTGTGCGLRLWKEVSGRYLTRSNIAQLLQEGSTHPLTGFRTKSGLEFQAALSLSNGTLQLSDVPDEGLMPDGTAGVAGPEPASPAAPHSSAAPRSSASARPRSQSKTPTARSAKTSAAPPPPSGPLPLYAPIAPCPVHGPTCQVLVTRGAFVCETRLQAFTAGASEPAGLMIPRLLCKRELTAAEVSGMLANGVSAELAGFVSKSGKEFSARLRLTPAGGFEFEFSRDPGPAKGKKVRRSSTQLKDDQRGRSVQYPRRRVSPRPIRDKADL